ncbi:tetratricopeptide repeat protein [Elusimicrobiota bacterium]
MNIVKDTPFGHKHMGNQKVKWATIGILGFTAIFHAVPSGSERIVVRVAHASGQATGQPEPGLSRVPPQGYPTRPALTRALPNTTGWTTLTPEERARESSPQSIRQRYDSGVDHYTAEQLEKARDAFREVLRMDPTHVPAGKALQRVMRELSLKDQAISYRTTLVSRSVAASYW